MRCAPLLFGGFVGRKQGKDADMFVLDVLVKEWVREEIARMPRKTCVEFRNLIYHHGIVYEQVEQSSDNRCVLWRTARVLVFEKSFK